MSTTQLRERAPAGQLDRAAMRAVDVAGSAIALAVFAPLMLAIALVVRATSRGPALLRQRRVGLDGQTFTVLKFRTMHVGQPDQAHRELIARELRGEATPTNGSSKLADDPRITTSGAWLRRTSLDELPQLINVLRGDMALVGPRPCLPWEAEMFPAAYQARFAVKPGITGLWQVNGRSTLGTLEMLDLDIDYVDTQSFASDVSILLRTIPVVLRGDGAR
jgi:lipopolysaccharide/colanic/teichoic acid biosynthesis glycosyltransferase